MFAYLKLCIVCCLFEITYVCMYVSSFLTYVCIMYVYLCLYTYVCMCVYLKLQVYVYRCF
jgi:hypothetical protein